MSGEIIRLGDKTSHGGTVIEGSSADICMGKPIAFIGHKVFCPLCKGAFPIIEGAATTTFYGKGVALAGMRTACGATLIATQFTDRVDRGGGGGAAGPSNNPPRILLRLQLQQRTSAANLMIASCFWMTRLRSRSAGPNTRFGALRENSNMA